jgi:hypothetical protein
MWEGGDQGPGAIYRELAVYNRAQPPQGRRRKQERKREERKKETPATKQASLLPGAAQNEWGRVDEK